MDYAFEYLEEAAMILESGSNEQEKDTFETLNEHIEFLFESLVLDATILEADEVRSNEVEDTEGGQIIKNNTLNVSVKDGFKEKAKAFVTKIMKILEQLREKISTFIRNKIKNIKTSFLLSKYKSSKINDDKFLEKVNKVGFFEPQALVNAYTKCGLFDYNKDYNKYAGENKSEANKENAQMNATLSLGNSGGKSYADIPGYKILKYDITAKIESFEDFIKLYDRTNEALDAMKVHCDKFKQLISDGKSYLEKVNDKDDIRYAKSIIYVWKTKLSGSQSLTKHIMNQEMRILKILTTLGLLVDKTNEEPERVTGEVV